MHSDHGSIGPGQRQRVAQYIRMSTDHQRYSVENQEATIREYADLHGFEIVRTYLDEGKSGLSIKDRYGLQQLLDDVHSRRADYGLILVYDVSRWGRFQDVDESAFYEYACKLSGVNIVYCTEPFENDGTTVSSIIKTIKRAMAGEYSRELSVKIFTTQRRAASQGFWTGGSPGFGLRRVVVTPSGDRKYSLEPGEAKATRGNRVVLVPGPPDEVAAIQFIFDQFVTLLRTPYQIAGVLNARGTKFKIDRKWTAQSVKRILMSGKYAGRNIYNRRCGRLTKPVGWNPKEEWVQVENAFEPVVSPEIFAAAEKLLERKPVRPTTDEIVESLRGFYKQHGVLSTGIIDAAPNLPSSTVVRNRLGGMMGVHKVIGSSPVRDASFVESRPRVFSARQAVLNEVWTTLNAAGLKVRSLDNRTELLLLGEGSTFAVIMSRQSLTAGGVPVWRVHFPVRYRPDFYLVQTMDREAFTLADRYLFPGSAVVTGEMHISAVQPLRFEAFRIRSLEPLIAAVSQAATPKA